MTNAVITYRMLFGNDVSQIPIGAHADDVVTCNCKWDNGHESNCNIVKANELLKLVLWCPKCDAYHAFGDPHLLPR